ncbi:MAG: pantetheine-phosphate adenylyltransferase [Tissierellia bacterium]|nr:pantetheine-phosphate adenylyltransferase [Tissierellia bacterium]
MKVVYPGSFDPVTNGHLDIIRRAAVTFDEVVVAVLVNSQKKGLFSMEERIEMLQELLYDYDNVSVKLFSGLLVDFLEDENIDAIIRGLRAVADYEVELQLAHLNKYISKGKYETLFMVAGTDVSFLSSSVVKEIASYHGDISNLVPDQIVQRIYDKYKEK